MFILYTLVLCMIKPHLRHMLFGGQLVIGSSSNTAEIYHTCDDSNWDSHQHIYGCVQ